MDAESQDETREARMQRTTRGLAGNRWWRVVWLGGLVLVVGALGCHRAYYREQADREAEALIAEKSDDPRWAISDFSVDVDERSRYASPHDPVRPPMPPDDPRSHELMHAVGGEKGYAKWHANGDTFDLESPAWREKLGEYVEIDEEGRLKLRLEDSVQLAIIHSPGFQRNLETLYLSALDVSTERFGSRSSFMPGMTTRFLTGERMPSGGNPTVW